MDAMLVIFNCRIIYSYDFEALNMAIREHPEITIAVCGNIDDVDSGKLDSAKEIFQTSNFEICAVGNTLSNIAMARLLMNRFDKEPENVIVVSDDQRDGAAADAIGCRFLTPDDILELLLRGK